MKKIIINGRFLTHRVTGVQRYAREICNELDKIINPGEVVMAIPPETRTIPNYKNIKVVRTGRFHNRAWEHISFPQFVKKINGISLNLCNTAPLSDPGIVCIHDVRVKAIPKDFSKKFLIWYELLFHSETKKADRILTVSNFSKNEIEKYYHVKPEKITVIPNGWQHYERIEFDKNALSKYGLEKGSYFFSMCSLEPNKNFKWIANVALTRPDDLFVVAGGINRNVFSKGFGFECPSNMKFIGYISDSEAKTLMNSCRAFLFPTFYEGFGIPPMEAMSAGCKNVVVSDSTVMHEIYDNSVTYINPYKYEFILNEEDKTKDIQMVLEKYSWKKSANILKECLTKMGGGKE